MQQSGSEHNVIYILGLRQPLICGCRARPRKLFTVRLSICLRVHLYVREGTHPVGIYGHFGDIFINITTAFGYRIN